jgi:membrane-associated phospholipid phosphatase
MSIEAQSNARRHPSSKPQSEIEKADVDLGRTIASGRGHPAGKAVAKAAKIGDQGPLYALSGVVVIVGLATRNRRLADSGVALLAALAMADVSKRVIKRLVRRTRPHVLLEEARYEADAGGSKRKPEQSFPSGHTAGSVAVARALSRNYPRSGRAAGVAALAIGISRIVKGAHWPLDVIGGAIIGLAAEAASDALLRVGSRRVVEALRCAARG